jgi:ParB/RepB/Spo0J family partition protein
MLLVLIFRTRVQSASERRRGWRLCTRVRNMHHPISNGEDVVTETEQIARLIPIHRIRPDVDQPRRLLPVDLAQSLAAGSSPFDVLGQLRARSERDKWIRERLEELDALARSIADDGLMQPIRVFRDDDEHYRIEEGERRWWAHHILVQQGKEQFQNIAAFVVEPESTSRGLLRRRVAENVLRSGFTAIELAQAMAKRIQEILTTEPGIKQGEVERRVGSENGMSDRRVRQFVALLMLSPEAQELAQQARLTENSLRKVVGIKDAASQLTAIRELMHPAQSKMKSRRRLHSGKRSDNSRRLNPKPRGNSRRTITKVHLLGRKQQISRGSRRKKISSGDTKQIALQNLLAVAQLFQTKGMEALDRADWMRVTKRETDRRTLANLRDILDRGLAVAQEVEEKGATPSNE